MKSNSRTEINDRFKIAFKYLEKTGGVIKGKYRGKKTISDFAQKILGNRNYGHVIKAFLKGERGIPVKFLPNMEKHYGVSLDWLLTGKGDMIKHTGLIDEKIKLVDSNIISHIDDTMKQLERYHSQLRELKTLIQNNKISEHEKTIYQNQTGV